ncbi:MAG: GGDEF domain-containing protein, partial [Pseudomonadota bacterium]
MFESLKRLLMGTLRRQLIVGVFLLIASMMSLLVWNTTVRQRAAELEQQTEQVTALVQSAATSSAIMLSSRDFSGLQEVVQSVGHYPDLQYAMVLDLNGQILAHTDHTKRGLYLTDLPNGSKLYVIQRTLKIVDVTGPVVITNRPIGWVRIGVSGETIGIKLAEITRSGILYTLIAMAISVLLAALAGRY